MAYTYTQIDTWAKICQPLAAIGEARKKSFYNDDTADENLHIKIYDARLSMEWEYEQDPNSLYLYKLQNYVLALCGVYLLEAQQISVSGGIVVIPTTPTSGTSVSMPFYWAYVNDFANATDFKKAEFIGRDIDVFFQNGNRYLENDEYVLLADGTVRVLIDGFDSSAYTAGKKIIRVDINGSANNVIVSSYPYVLTGVTEIPNLPTGYPYQERSVVITPNGFTYTWGTNFEFTDTYPEQPDAYADGTTQIYYFTYDPTTGKDICTGQSLNASE